MSSPRGRVPSRKLARKHDDRAREGFATFSNAGSPPSRIAAIQAAATTWPSYQVSFAGAAHAHARDAAGRGSTLAGISAFAALKPFHVRRAESAARRGGGFT